jgi:small-conductance mechanosensitive channel
VGRGKPDVAAVAAAAAGTPLSYSEYLNPALVPVWPTMGWLRWSILSWWPILALLAMALTYLGWRLFWFAQDWVPSHTRAQVAASVLVPPLALVLAYRDARLRHLRSNARLELDVEEARAEVNSGPGRSA